MIVISSLYVGDHVELSTVYLQSAAINVFTYLLNKLKQSGLAEKRFDNIFQAIVALRVSYGMPCQLA